MEWTQIQHFRIEAARILGRREDAGSDIWLADVLKLADAINVGASSASATDEH